MKKHFLILCALAGTSLAQAQSNWNTSGSTVLTTTNGYVGIGTVSPTTYLHVEPNFNGAQVVPMQQNPIVNFAYIDQANNTKNLFHLSYDGNLGLGTINPSDKLHIENGGLYVNNGNVGVLGGLFVLYDNPTTPTFKVGVGTVDLYNSTFTVHANGSSNVNFKIDAAGNTWARNMKVTASAIPDYVFEKDYTLMNLAELEQYISQNKHLPNIPSATEYEAANGVDVGELQLKLLEKVEELTLHLIQLNKKCINLEAEITALQQGKK